MRDNIPDFEDRRRLEYGFRQLEVLILEERLAALFTGAAAAPEPRAIIADETPTQGDEASDV